VGLLLLLLLVGPKSAADVELLVGWFEPAAGVWTTVGGAAVVPQPASTRAMPAVEAAAAKRTFMVFPCLGSMRTNAP
jgi:hypothetical protein